MSYREQPAFFMSLFDFTDNFGGLFSVFLNVVTPVFILVVIGHFIGPRLNVLSTFTFENSLLCACHRLYYQYYQ